MHLVTLVSETAGCFLIIASHVSYDPLRVRRRALTEPTHPWEPLAVVLGPTLRFTVVLPGRSALYTLGTGKLLFWGGDRGCAGRAVLFCCLRHEFLAAYPPALGFSPPDAPWALGPYNGGVRSGGEWNARAARKRDELAKVALPFLAVAGELRAAAIPALFSSRLCGRAARSSWSTKLVLAGWLLFTRSACAITVGYLFGGKAWCNTSSDGRPCKRFYSTPSGLLGSKAHTSEQFDNPSMCRHGAGRGMVPEQSALPVPASNPTFGTSDCRADVFGSTGSEAGHSRRADRGNG